LVRELFVSEEWSSVANQELRTYTEWIICLLQYRERRDDPEPPKVAIEGQAVNAGELYEAIKGQNFTTPAGVKSIILALREITKIVALPQILKKESLREEKHELLLHAFHEIVQRNSSILDTMAKIVCNHSGAIAAPQLQPNQCQPNKMGDRWNKIKGSLSQPQPHSSALLTPTHRRPSHGA